MRARKFLQGLHMQSQLIWVKEIKLWSHLVEFIIPFCLFIFMTMTLKFDPNSWWTMSTSCLSSGMLTHYLIAGSALFSQGPVFHSPPDALETPGRLVPGQGHCWTLLTQQRPSFSWQSHIAGQETKEQFSPCENLPDFHATIFLLEITFCVSITEMNSKKNE